MSEPEIFERIKGGDEKALELIYKKYYRMMTKLVITNSGTEDEARDVYQDALVVFWQKARSGNLVMTSKMSTYIYSICQNLWRKELELNARR
jgi:DNA-directed RNA polymerase specialized sigma24 family protein